MDGPRLMCRWLVPLGALAVTLVPSRADESRRLFDVTPVSAANPVVATIDGRIALPVSELRAFQQAERLHALPAAARLADKRAVLDDLIGEYLLVDEAYRTGVPESPRFAGQREATRTLMLADELTEKTIPLPAAANAGADGTALADRLFDDATLDVSNEAYAVVRRCATEIDGASAASRLGPTNDAPEVAARALAAIVAGAPDGVLVRYDGDQALRVHEVLAIYAGLPPPRPNVQTHEGFLAMIKPLVVPHLMALKAARDGLAADPGFQRRLVRNENVLLRFHMQGLIEAEANRQLSQPDVDQRLHAWHDAHRSIYRSRDGIDGPATFAEAKPRVLADYSVALVEELKAAAIARLRKHHAIVVNDEALGAWQP